MAQTAAGIPKVVQTMLDEGVNVTPGGAVTLKNLINSTGAQIKAITDAAPGKIFPEDVTDTLVQTVTKFANQVDNPSDLAAIAKSADNFLASRSSSGMRPGTPMSVAEAQKLKQGTYQVLGGKAYGEQGSAAIEAQKGMARGLKESIERLAPEVKSLNARQSANLEALDAVGRRAGLAANRDFGGIFWIAHNPEAFLAAQFDRSPALKSMLANGLYKSASIVSHVSPQLLRLAMQLVASKGEEP